MNKYSQGGNNSQPGFIEMREVNKIYHTTSGDFHALKDISMKIYQGEFVSVAGKSGSGKTTLINMITGIDHPTSGTVRINGTHLHELGEGKTAIWRGKNMGIVFQFFQLLPTLSVMENVLLPMDFCNQISYGEREKRARELLEEMDLGELIHKSPAAISGGHQQCAAIARALANDPPIILADEPTGNLDTNTAEMVLNMFDRLVDRGKTIILVTHDRDLADRAHRKLVISDGILVDETLYSLFPSVTDWFLSLLQGEKKTMFFGPEEMLRVSEKNPDPIFLLITEGCFVYAGKQKIWKMKKTSLKKGSVLPRKYINTQWKAGSEGAQVAFYYSSEKLESHKQEMEVLVSQLHQVYQSQKGCNP